MSVERIAAAKRELDAAAAATGWQRTWVPFLDDDAGDYLCLDTALAGAPVRGFWLGNRDHPIVAQALTDWLEDFVTHLEKRKYLAGYSGKTDKVTYLATAQVSLWHKSI